MDAAGLRSIKIFGGASEEHLDALARHVRELSVREGTHVVSQGDPATDLMAIIDGEAEVVRDGRTIATLSAGDTFGEMGVIDHVQRATNAAGTMPPGQDTVQRTATVVATTAMHLVVLTAWDVKRLGLEAWFEILDQADQRAVPEA